MNIRPLEVVSCKKNFPTGISIKRWSHSWIDTDLGVRINKDSGNLQNIKKKLRLTTFFLAQPTQSSLDGKQIFKKTSRSKGNIH